MNQPSVAVVILNWNGKGYLEQFLPFVVNSTYQNVEIILTDNASTDDSVAFVKECYPQIRIIQHVVNEGFAKGYNSALKQVHSDYYVLLNSDVEVTQNWIEPIIALMESDRKIGACQPKILSYHNRAYFEYAGASGGWIDYFGYPFARGRVFDVCEIDKGQYDNAVPCFWASGAAMFVRSAAYWDAGGLDEYFFAHQEEIDLCWRMQLKGNLVFVQPQSVVYHVGGGTLPVGNSRKVFLNYRNNLIMIAKNLPLKSSLIRLPIRFGLDGIAAWRGLLSGDPGYFVTIAKAHFHFLGWLIFKKTSIPKIAKTLKLSNGIYRGSIISSFFLKGKKNFSEIISSK